MTILQPNSALGQRETDVPSVGGPCTPQRLKVHAVQTSSSTPTDQAAPWTIISIPASKIGSLDLQPAEAEKALGRIIGKQGDRAYVVAIDVVHLQALKEQQFPVDSNYNPRETIQSCKEWLTQAANLICSECPTQAKRACSDLALQIRLGHELSREVLIRKIEASTSHSAINRLITPFHRWLQPKCERS